MAAITIATSPSIHSTHTERGQANYDPWKIVHNNENKQLKAISFDCWQSKLCNS